jgi:hypothetical protein
MGVAEAAGAGVVPALEAFREAVDEAATDLGLDPGVIAVRAAGRVLGMNSFSHVEKDNGEVGVGAPI